MVLAVVIVASSWRRIHDADEKLVTDGPYAVVRHPQYTGLMLGILGALVQWPTLITLLMAPILVFTYTTGWPEGRSASWKSGSGTSTLPTAPARRCCYPA